MMAHSLAVRKLRLSKAAINQDEAGWLNRKVAA
jgi:hypothetical protein